jgi:hypothetical protein
MWLRLEECAQSEPEEGNSGHNPLQLDPYSLHPEDGIHMSLGSTADNLQIYIVSKHREIRNGQALALQKCQNLHSSFFFVFR